MRTITFAEAIEESIAHAMSNDPNVIILGEDVHILRVNLFSRFGGKRVINAPISESAFLEHKLPADYWLDYMGSGGRENLKFDVPKEGAKGDVPDHWEPLQFGRAAIKKNGTDLTIVSVGVGVHRSMEAATLLTDKNISAEVIDLRTVWPLDSTAIVESVSKTGHLLVVDEDYKQFGLSGEIAAVVLEHSTPFKYGRVCTNDTIPYSHSLEIEAIPGIKRIVKMALSILSR